MSQNGYINAVAIVKAGSNLKEDAASSSTTIYLDNAYDFNEGGGNVEINGVVYAYTAADLENDVLTLATGLTADVEASFPASVIPNAMEKRASISMADTGDSIDVRVPHNLYDRIPEGIRADNERESVTVEISGGEWAIVDVFGKEASIDGAYLNPSTVPPQATDGFPPEESPTPIALGTVGIILLKWAGIENHDPVTYQVHMSVTEGFTPDSTTLLARTTDTTRVVRALPDNSLVSYAGTYWFRLIAEDADGAAEPSDDVSASPVQVTDEDIAANYVYAGNIIADQINGGTVTSDLTLASTIKTAETGARAELSSAGLLITDSTGAPTTRLGTDTENFFKGTIEANGLTVNGGATFRSTTNELSRAAVLTLAAGVTSSTTAPTAVIDWEKLPLLDADGNAWPTPGNLRGLYKTSAGKWMAVDTTGAVIRWNADGTLFDSYATTTAVGANATVQVGTGSRYVIKTVGSATSIVRLDQEDIFTDNFSGTLAGWTSSYGTTAIDTGRAKVTLPNNNTAGIKRSLEGIFKTRAVAAKVIPPSDRDSGTDIYMKVVKDANNQFAMRLRGTTLFCQATLAGTPSNLWFAYNDTDDAYWRIFEFAGNLSFQTSPDAITWENHWTKTGHGLSTANLTGMTWEIGGLTPAAGAGNLITNGTFEVGTTDWIPANGTTTLSSSTVHARTNACGLLLDGPTGTTAVGARHTGVSVTAGVSYDLKAYGYAPEASGNTAELKAKWYDASGTIGNDSVEIKAINNTGFILLSGTVTAPVGATTLKLEIWNTDTSGNGSDSWWDDVSVIQTGTSPTFTMYADDARYHSVVGSMTYTRVNTTQAPTLGYDGTNLMVAEYDGSNNYVVKHISPADMTTVASTFTSATVTGFSGPLAGVLKGSFDIGDDRYFVSRDNTTASWWYSLKSSDGTYKGAETFEVITSGHRGMAWDGTNFWALGTDGNLYKHTNITWVHGTDSAAWNVGFTWYDGSTQESGVSPYASLTMKMRARLTVTSATIPYSGVGDPDRIRVYVGRGAGSKYLQATSAATVNTVTLTTATFSGTVAPTVSTFLSATPAKIRNSDDSLVISADGTIKGKSEILSSTTDATATTGNRPALITGDVSGQHLRIDGDEIISMSGDATQGTLTLNPGMGTILGAGIDVKGIRAGSFTGTTNASGVVTVTHGGSTAPNYFLMTTAFSHQIRCSGKLTTTCSVVCYAFGSATTANSASVNFDWVAIWT